jgi:hypothetical protein
MTQADFEAWCLKQVLDAAPEIGTAVRQTTTPAHLARLAMELSASVQKQRDASSPGTEQHRLAIQMLVTGCQEAVRRRYREFAGST